jgi:hypothetical protein
MRDEPARTGPGGGIRARRTWLAALCGALALVALGPPARAEGLFGSLQVQAQRIEDVVFVTQPDGTLVPRQVARSQFVQSYDVNHRDYPREDLLIHTALRFTGISFSNSPNTLRTPEGSIRMVHPWMNLFASRIASTAKVGVGVSGSTAQDTGAVFTVTTKQVEDQIVAHVAPPHWPELVGSWRERERKPTDLSPGESSRERMARASYYRDRGSIYAGWSDHHSERTVSAATPLDQTVASAGGSIRLSPLRHTALTAQYDVTDTRSGFTGQRQARTRTDVGEASGTWRPRPTLYGDMNVIYRRTQSTQALRAVQNDWEGVALGTWQRSRGVKFSAGGGTHTVLGLDRDKLVSYLTAIASGDGRVRRDWLANGQVSLTRNFDPVRGRYTVGIAGGSTHMAFSPRAILDGTAQVTTNGDTATVEQRVSSSWNLRLSLIPLRSFTASVGLRSFRVGPRFLHANAVSTTRGLDLTWRPMPKMDITGSFASTGLMPYDNQRVTTQSVLGHYAPNASLSLIGTWSHSSQKVTSTGSAQLTGHEIASARAQLALSRRLTASAGFTVAEPGRPQRTRQVDGVVTWSFGR